MLEIPSQLYPRWRARVLAGDALREIDEAPPERLLQQVWQHQRLQRERLRTVEGKRVRVLHPGFWNREAGPDFREAVLQFGNDRPVVGDIEIDLRPAAWRGHRHENNPAYRRVILHVVWDGESPAVSALPTLALKSCLDAPLRELRRWLGTEPGWPDVLAGQCSAPLRAVSEPVLSSLLQQAAFVRLQGKGDAFAARARQAGWEQSLWEGLFGALGFKHNAWPMRRMAELLPILASSGSRSRGDAFLLQARLLGVSGLLPFELGRGATGTDQYLRRIWDLWWRESGQFGEVTLPRTLWRLGGQRPANQPTRRLALAGHWLASGDLPERLERWFTAKIPDARLETSLAEILRPGSDDDFWSYHWTLRSGRMARPQPLLGRQRAADLAINVILPWFRIRAVSGGNHVLRQTAESRYFAWPKGQDNATLRLARQRLFGGTAARELRSAALQQGILQIARDFCEQSNALCENCRFPGLVMELNTSTTPGCPGTGAVRS